MKTSENNETDEIGFVIPTPGLLVGTMLITMLQVSLPVSRIIDYYW